ncbi:hypothetical protein HNR19_003458 [Nocardioides thalensis]|uniref:Uncharacterized protein n=1 Tax=Nocardioides thalensis TaxID=1914755 RepID=A0A853C3P3_9ACTN|nr:hypothetical protein [Nocardioides thalensis]NYJ02760.1 hypothetical protein [Nocardioides thalensis]
MTDDLSPSGVADAVASDLLADGDIDVTSWTDLEHLPREMDALAAQYAEIFGYARTWVCQRAGFEPSPVCLLRPLAELMDVLTSVLGTVERVGRDHWDDLHDGVVATTADLRTVDAWVADVLPVVA